MKRRNLLIAIASILVMFAFAACSESVALEDRLGTITFGENSSRAVGTVVKYSNEVEDMIWFYSATKQDDGYTTGKTDGFEAVAEATKKSGDNNTTTYEATAGLSGQTLNNNFSYGLWEIVLEGYKKDNVEVSSEGKVTIKADASAEYTATISNFLVSKGANYATAKIELGDNPTTEIVFDAVEGISFESANIKATSSFTLAVTDTKGTVAVATSDGVNDVNVEKGKVTFYDLTYAPKTGVDISGEHTMNFVLSQTLSGTDNTTIEAALYTLKFSVQKGTTTTISGTLVKNDVTGTVQINSVQDVPRLSVNRVLEVKDIDSSKSIATITSERTIKYGDMEVTYPAGAKIATTADTLSVDEGENTGTSDAEIGFVYKDATAPTDNEGQTITIAEANSSEKYELTLSASTADTGDTKNTVLLTIKKNVGVNREISAVYHEKTSLAKYSDLAVENQTTTESYEYDKTTGVLTLRLFHASDIFIITKEYVAEADGTKYYSLSDAITKVEDDGTVTLLRPVTLSDTITISKSITLDMARRAVTGDGKITVVAGGIVTVQNSAAQTGDFINASAKIGSSADANGKYFYSLKEGIDSSVGGTVILVKDIKSTEGLVPDPQTEADLCIPTDVIVDFNKHTLTLESTGIWIGREKSNNSNESFTPTVTFKNGTITGHGSYLSIYDVRGSFILDYMTIENFDCKGYWCILVDNTYDANLEIKNSKINCNDDYALKIGQYGTLKGSALIENTEIRANTGAVYVDYEKAGENSYSITIKSSHLKGGDYGLLVEQANENVKIDIEDSTFTGADGAVLWGGNYTIKNSTFNGTGDDNNAIAFLSNTGSVKAALENVKLVKNGIQLQHIQSSGTTIEVSGTLSADSVMTLNDTTNTYAIEKVDSIPTFKVISED